ncbi:hypothetical protein BS50DRAFT_22907 [Corynespora cassiicola Philippines]|uniref:Uncharacterized protein n=1 Tax=Corynespora cassiicola Philippines TaxID=1448308 RepID=A0A2T2PB15_CORCC|nr:hypothetical protein BS50DRAFT_22907 [Corynespora cassiicola Philippines]
MEQSLQHESQKPTFPRPKSQHQRYTQAVTQNQSTAPTYTFITTIANVKAYHLLSATRTHHFPPPPPYNHSKRYTLNQQSFHSYGYPSSTSPSPIDPISGPAFDSDRSIPKPPNPQKSNERKNHNLNRSRKKNGILENPNRKTTTT